MCGKFNWQVTWGNKLNGPGEILVIGAGPGGLTAAAEIAKHGGTCTILESDSVVGGISRTVEKNGYRFDIGGHRFFTKVQRVEDFWHQTLPDDDFLLRPRMSRIYYNGKFFDYPLRASNALKNLGLVEAILCVLSYVGVRVRAPKNQSTFEGWVAARFGWRLYRTFFKTYTEKVWGVPANQIQSDWAAQRIKNLSLWKAAVHSILPRGRNSTEVTSLIERFQYPKYGPGMMWEACAAMVQECGTAIHFEESVVEIARANNNHIEIRTSTDRKFQARQIISTMPIGELVRSLRPQAPDSVLEAASKLKHRDFLTVALVVPARFSFPDNWIYIHDPNVKVGRVQNYGSWSPYLVKEGRTCLGLEYFVNQGDHMWDMPDSDLIKMATNELVDLGLIPTNAVEAGFVVRVPKTYPVYDLDYSTSLETIRNYLANAWPEIHPIGRNGMHRYNNQDHSMLTAMLTVDNLFENAQNDVWNVNVESQYHEEIQQDSRGSTGRSAPLFQSGSD